MNILNVSSGREFELYIQNLFLKNNIPVYDTPTTNDYGADLVSEYNNYRFVIQCKYYSKNVGVKAVQEVIGALSYYQANYGIVITNSLFTQQAKNLSISKNILLINGDVLADITSNLNMKRYLDEFILSEGSMNIVNQSSEEWLINDLVIRYGVSSAKIYKDFLSRNLPYYKVGREYRFDSKKVMLWEIVQKTIPYGRNDVIELPAFVKLKQRLLQELKDAKKLKDKARMKSIKNELKVNGMITSKFVLYISLFFVIGSSIVFLYFFNDLFKIFDF